MLAIVPRNNSEKTTQKRRERPNVLYAEVPEDTFKWLGKLPGPDDKPNRSWHVRQAVKMYRTLNEQGSAEALSAKIEELDKARALTQLGEDEREWVTTFHDLKDVDESALQALGRISSLALHHGEATRAHIQTFASLLESAVLKVPLQIPTVPVKKGRRNRKAEAPVAWRIDSPPQLK